jgi:spore coat protein U-like protein
MKIKTLVAASALAATGVIGTMSHQASASCGVSITVDNDHGSDVTVNWALSKVRAKVAGVAGTWATIGNYSTSLDADTSGSGDEATRAFTLGLPCGNQRQYKLYVSDGTNSWYEYQNEVGPSGTWTTDITPFIDLELP